MSSTIERAALGLVLCALGAAGFWTRCDASQAPADGPRSEARARRARGGRASASFGSEARDAAWSSGDGGVELGMFDDEEVVCWTVRTIDPLGAPVAALVLVAEPSRAEDAIEVRTSAATGAAEVCTPTFVDLSIDAWSDDGAWGRISTWIEGPDEGEDPVAFASSHRVEVVLAAPTAVAGRVVDARGEPMAGVRIEVADHWGADGRECRSPRTLEITGAEDWRSDADGRFELPLGVFGYFRVCADEPGFVSDASHPFPARPGTRAEVELVLEPAEQLRGLVTHRGRPVPGARIYADWAGGGEQALAADGSFAIGGLPVGARLDVHVVADGFVPRTFPRLALGGEHRLELEAGASLEVVVDVGSELASCRAEGGLRIVVQVRTDGGGVVGQQGSDAREPIVIPDLPPGRASVRAWTTGASAETEVDLAARSTTRARLRLATDTEQGVLRVSATGGPAPEEGAPLVLRIVRDDDLEVVEVLHDPVRCTALPPGRYRVSAEAGDLVGLGVTDVRAGGRADLALRLAPGAPSSERAWWEPGGEHACDVPLSTVLIDGRTHVAEVAPAIAGLLPGDELILPEDEPYLTAGPEGSVASFAVRREDGTVQPLAVARTRCE